MVRVDQVRVVLALFVTAGFLDCTNLSFLFRPLLFLQGLSFRTRHFGLRRSTWASIIVFFLFLVFFLLLLLLIIIFLLFLVVIIALCLLFAAVRT
jgi:hypothetical protein